MTSIGSFLLCAEFVLIVSDLSWLCRLDEVVFVVVEVIGEIGE